MSLVGSITTVYFPDLFPLIGRLSINYLSKIKQYYYKIIVAIMADNSNKQKKYILPDQEDRINPQYKGITQKYSTIKNKRLELDRRKQSLQTNMYHYERTKNSLDQKLRNKKHQLRWLKDVRQRHISDIRYKLQQQELNNKKLQQLRYQSELARKTSRHNIFNALVNLKQQKLKTKNQVKRQLQQIKMIKKQRQEEQQMYYTIRSKELEQEKSLSKSKINNFYRKKNKVLLNSYREMIRDQQQMNQKSQTQISFIKTKTSDIDEKIKKKKDKLKSIQDQIIKLKFDTTDIKSLYGNSLQMSKVTRKSSRPYQILVKQSFTSEFPFEQIHNQIN